MSTKPILFRPEMVRAIQAGTKTETRRLKNKYAIGDILWVRETWRERDSGDVVYRADGGSGPWRPSIFMPKWICRLWLLVEAVRQERLLEIDDAGARREGVADRDEFLRLWNSIHGVGAHLLEPWVSVVCFRRVPRPDGWPGRGGETS